MHLDVPHLPPSVLKLYPSTTGAFSLGYHIREVWWPEGLSEAQSKGLVKVLPDGKVAVSAVDSSARAVLHVHRQRFAVCYPLLIQERPLDGKFDYIWHTQVFSMQSYPARWQPAVELLLGAADLEELRDSDQTLDQQEGPSPTTPLALLDVRGQPSPACSVLPLPADREGPSTALNTDFPPDSWWFEATLALLPNDQVITLEWTPAATYQFLPQCGSGEVEVWIHQDESCLRSTKRGHFLAHYKGAGQLQQQQLYASQCVPEYVWSSGGGERYLLGHIAAHALKLR